MYRNFLRLASTILSALFFVLVLMFVFSNTGLARFDTNVSYINPSQRNVDRQGAYEGSIKPHSDEFTFTVYLPTVMSSYSYTNTITDITFDPPSPASLNYWDSVDIAFKYTTIYTGGVQMWAIGYADGKSQPYAGSGSYAGPSSGVITRSITVFGATGIVTVDTVKFIMRTEDGLTLVEFNVPVEYIYTPR